MYKLGNIVGRKVIAIRALRLDKRKKVGLQPRYILFDDKETIIELTEQDYYSYHDCSYHAREINVYQDKERWKEIFGNMTGQYPAANFDVN
jgi:hypothetical protein